MTGMVVKIAMFGANPAAYNEFVKTTVDSLTPTQPVVSEAYLKETAKIIRLVAFLVLVLILLVVIVMSLIYTRKYNANPAFIVCVVAIFLAMAAMVWYAATSMFVWEAKRLAPRVQKNLTNSVLYALNSAIRDGVFIITTN